jgi:GNAT superfamily N-acetyltransferase
MTSEKDIYKIVKYSPTYKTAIIDLLKGMWSDYDESGRYELFRWRYEENPYEKPIIFLAVDNEKVIGFRGFISQIFIKDENEYFVFSPSDTYIHREYRRKGIISALNDKCMEELNTIYKKENTILINTSTSKPSMPVYLKQNWKKSNGLRSFYFRYSVFNLLKNKMNNHEVSESIVLHKKQNYKIEITPKVKSNELSSFNAKIRNHFRWTNIRDEKFFNWRYGFLPEKYTCVYCYFNKELQGYLVIKKLNDNQSSIDQFEALNPKIFKLMLIAAFKNLRIVQLRSYAFLPEEKKLLTTSGFFAEPVKLLKKLGHLRFPVLVRPLNLQPEEKDYIIAGSDISDIYSWHLQVSDRH